MGFFFLIMPLNTTWIICGRADRQAHALLDTLPVLALKTASLFRCGDVLLISLSPIFSVVLKQRIKAHGIRNPRSGTRSSVLSALGNLSSLETRLPSGKIRDLRAPRRSAPVGRSLILNRRLTRPKKRRSPGFFSSAAGPNSYPRRLRRRRETRAQCQSSTCGSGHHTDGPWAHRRSSRVVVRDRIRAALCASRPTRT